MRGVFRWAWAWAWRRRGSFEVSVLALGVVSIFVSNSLALPPNPTWGQRIVNGLIGLLVALMVVIVLSLGFALLVAPYLQRNALRRRMLALQHRDPPSVVIPARLVKTELQAILARVDRLMRLDPTLTEDYVLPSARWTAHQAQFAALESYDRIAKAYQEIARVNDQWRWRREGAGKNRIGVNREKDGLEVLEAVAKDAIVGLDVVIARGGATPAGPAVLTDHSTVVPLQIRHAQREPYATARFPMRPPDVHAVGVYNPMGNPVATHVRVEIMGMDPLPKNARGSPPEFPAIVPIKRGGDPRGGLTLNPDTEELWDIATASRDGSGNLFVQGIASANWPLGSRALWDFQRDERWRLRYQASADYFPTTSFTIVMAVVEGVIRCQVEGG
jgi:hypothetical protein